MFAGIRCRTTSAIHIHDIIDVTIQITAAAGVMDVMLAGGVMGVTGVADAMAGAAMVMDVMVADVTAADVIRRRHVTVKDVKVKAEKLAVGHGTVSPACRALTSEGNLDVL